MSSERVACFTCTSDMTYFEFGGGTKFVSSFLHFHPEIDLYVFGKETMDGLFNSGRGLNWKNVKPSAAKLLTDRYDLIMHFDNDCMILAPLTDILEDDYLVGAAGNFNWFLNLTVAPIPPIKYLNASTVASRLPHFWDDWEEINKGAMAYPTYENDTLNLLLYQKEQEYQLKAFGHDCHNQPTHYHNSMSLGRWHELHMNGDDVMLDDKRVFTLHQGGWGGYSSPKLQYHSYFPSDVARYMDQICGHKFTINNDKVQLC